MPVRRVKTRVKWKRSEKPVRSAITSRLSSGRRIIAAASPIRLSCR